MVIGDLHEGDGFLCMEDEHILSIIRDLGTMGGSLFPFRFGCGFAPFYHWHHLRLYGSTSTGRIICYSSFLHHLDCMVLPLWRCNLEPLDSTPRVKIGVDDL